ncbi:glutathione peroxidase [Ruminococcus albus]|uniref:Glutathione peroxidase n=1 Tax=Ruminococcus albus TaxID=1264 RepID=A0A1I1NHE2_RUMAL|nr:glutathione peroxidase [Ruminococcus albus]SFC97059.1 glutathione peroxidase [Ruminococcus albus]
MSVYENVLKRKDGSEFGLDELNGKVLLIVNTATGCGFTPQYKGLEKLYEEYKDKGLEILDIPCDQFGHQAPGSDDEIHEFCTLTYNTTFPRFAKSEINGENELPLYTFLKSQMAEDSVTGPINKTIMKGVEKLSTSCKKAGDIKWNFTKFLVDREGNVVGRYSPTTKPEELEKEIKKYI